MAAQQQSPMSARIPPDVPNDPHTSPALTQYLRNFALWARNGFAEQMRNDEAVRGLMVRASDTPPGANPKIFLISVGSDGRLTSTPMALGSGDLGTPILTFAPITAAVSASVANPTGTASTTFRMMGLSLILSSEIATVAEVTVDGVIANSANNGETDAVLCYGTGTPPANGAAQVGTILGQQIRYSGATGGSFAPFSMTRLVSGVTPLTPYWFDIALKAITGTGSVSGVGIVARGIAT